MQLVIQLHEKAVGWKDIWAFSKSNNFLSTAMFHQVWDEGRVLYSQKNNLSVLCSSFQTNKGSDIDKLLSLSRKFVFYFYFIFLSLAWKVETFTFVLL